MKVKTLVLVLVMTVPLAAFALAAPPSAKAARTWTLLGGGGTPDATVSLNTFYPRRVQIAVGDTITWQVFGFHNVAFTSGAKPPDFEIQQGTKRIANPAVAFPAGGKTYDGTGYANSGVPQDPSKPMTYSLTFAKAGTYSYLCIVHGPSMGGEVVVSDTATGDPAKVLAGARQQQAAATKAGQEAWAATKPDQMGNTVNVPMIGSVKDGYSILRFTRQPLVINRGTTVTWKMADPYEIHTVTFGSGAKPIDYVTPEPQKQGPPLLVINPKILTPTKAKTYAGTGFVNSGVLFPPGLPGNLPTSFSLTFTKAGTYQYYCAVHLPFMVGTVVVR
ncbi:MAG TPA: plastocyanin/azurin family copper-binding protein [bacterium]